MHRVLVMDDESAMNEYITDILKPAGFDVFAALDGVTGQEALGAHDPHVVILDIFMPGKDGLEVLIELRHRRSSVPVLVISGKQQLLSDSSMGLAKQLGADEVLAKPFTPEELIDRVSRLARAGGGRSHLNSRANETTFVTLRRCINVVKSRFGRAREKPKAEENAKG